MPTYTYLNTETGEEYDYFSTWIEREEFLRINPHILPVITAAAIVSGVSANSKIPSGFKDVLSKISAAHPTSEVANRHGKKTARQVKTSEIIKNHVKKMGNV